MDNEDFIVKSVDYKGEVIEIRIDEEPESPREWDNLGTMICKHKNYDLGDTNPSSRYQKAYGNVFSDMMNFYYNEFKDKIDKRYKSLANENEKYISAGVLTEEGEELVEKWTEDNIIDLPLYLFDHSGLTISTEPFDCPWDSGQVGFIYTDKDKYKRDLGVSRFTPNQYREAEKILKGEVDIYDKFLRGEVFGYIIRGSGYSCWGFFGEESFDEMISEAEQLIDLEKEFITGE